MPKLKFMEQWCVLGIIFFFIFVVGYGIMKCLVANGVL